jgi:long-subunit acyl-CoA synthetase (AMP-forming)
VKETQPSAIIVADASVARTYVAHTLELRVNANSSSEQLTLLKSSGKPRHLDDIVAILFTSGTTGVPKGVRFSENLCLPAKDSLVIFNPAIRVEVQSNDPTAIITLLGQIRSGGSQYFVDASRALSGDIGLLKPTQLALPVAIWTAMMRLYKEELQLGVYSARECEDRARERIGPRVKHASCGMCLCPNTSRYFSHPRNRWRFHCGKCG